jgi:hypothetical protein
VTAERQGVPAFGVMTERFVSAAEMMSRVLGMPGYVFAVIDHPVSSATDDQLKSMARTAIEQGVKMLVR